jgi:hypothetical protein
LAYVSFCSKSHEIFLLLNGNITEVDVQGMKLMNCVMCHFSKSSTSSHRSTKFYKGFLTYNPDHGIMAMKKHVTNEHGLDLVKYMAYKNDLEGKDGSK